MASETIPQEVKTRCRPLRTATGWFVQPQGVGFEQFCWDWVLSQMAGGGDMSTRLGGGTTLGFKGPKISTQRLSGTTNPLSTGGSEGFSGSTTIPGASQDVVPGFTQSGLSVGDVGQGIADAFTSSDCPGLTQVKIFGQCVELTDILPGGDPAVVGPVGNGGAAPPGVAVATPGAGSSFDGFGKAVMGFYGVGLQPRVEVQTVRRCPPGMALGKDGVCYEGLARNSPRREWPQGMKPLMTGGDRAAIAKAKRAATKLANAKKSLKATAKALEKVL